MTPVVDADCRLRPAGCERRAWLLALVLLLTTAAWAAPSAARADADRINGFDLSGATVAREEIVAGGPPRDGTVALEDPAVLAPHESPFKGNARVIGVVRGGEARAYPLGILEFHEIVNDTLGGDPIAVTYCPLCGTGMVFDRRAGAGLGGESKKGETEPPRRFGVSGLLYRSGLLMYDRESESLWSQIAARAITGPARGERLKLLPSEVVRWAVWQQRHPQTTIVSIDTGYERPYGRSAYAGYRRNKKLRFPAPLDDRYHPKLPTLGLRTPDGTARAYPVVEVRKAGGPIRESLGGFEVEVAFDAGRAQFTREAPPEVEVIEGYWFAWMAFHPESSVFIANDGEEATPSSRVDSTEPQ